MREVSAELIEVQSVPDDEVRALKAVELEVYFYGLIWSDHKGSCVNSFGFQLLELLDESFEGVSGVMDVLNDQDVLSFEILSFQGVFKVELSC